MDKKRKGSFITMLCLSMVLNSGCNRTAFDTKYGFDKAVISGKDSSIVLDVNQWKDYSGEQIQLTTTDNFVLLTSSFDTNCFYGDSKKYSASDFTSNTNNEVYHLTADENGVPVYNKDFIDTNWRFNKSITFNGNRALVLPIGQWTDYSGEQLQVITNDGLVLVLSSYNSKLVYDGESNISANNFASSYVSSNGQVTDFSSDCNVEFNYDLLDTEYKFDKAIIFKDNSAVILPVSQWRDYEGEQLQLKIFNGPTIVTASYDTILVDDANSKIKAIDVANGLSENVMDLSNGYNLDSNYNRTVFDFNNGFSNVIFSNDNSSCILPIQEWCDYEGEQLQVKLENGDVILSSSMMLDLVNGGTSKINASILGENYVVDGKIIDKSNGNTSDYSYNKTFFDFEQSFNYALKVINGNVTIIPLQKWTDFYNNDGGDSEDSPNCEQIQLILPDGTAIVTTAYDTMLVKCSTDILKIAEFFKSNEGIISDLRPYVGEPSASGWNFTFFDTRYQFTYSIVNIDGDMQIFPIKNWLDFSEGEQLQINFHDDTGILTSFVNTTLVDPYTEGIEEVIAKAFAGSLEKENGLVIKYK